MGTIKNGIYYPDEKPKALESSPTFKSWSHADQRSLHSKDVIQRHVGGKPNPEFIRAYPEQAAQQFSPEAIRKYGNQY